MHGVRTSNVFMPFLLERAVHLGIIDIISLMLNGLA